MEKSNIFKKILAIMGLLLIPVIGLYSYSNQISIHVVEDQIRQNSGDKLSFFVQQIDAEFDQYMISVNNLAIEPLVRAFTTLPSSSTNSELFETKLSLQDDLDIKGKAGILKRAYTLYAPLSGEVVSTHGSISYKQMFVDTVHKGELKPFIWTYSVEDNSRIPNAFVYRIVEPLFVYEDLEQADLVGEIRVDTRDIADMLTRFKADSPGDPFLYHENAAPIVARTADMQRINELLPLFEKYKEDVKQGTFLASLQNEEYMILYAKSEATGWYLIEYMPLESILSPITSSRNWFWISLCLILLISVLSAFLLYRNVQVPIRELYLAAKRLRRGDYTVRVGSRKHDEFGYLFEQFNLMSEQIQHLINSIYAEKLHAREATLKQLQSQINPHFLYNCLFFIKNMTRIGERDAVMAMAVKLGDYYRYTTHVDQQETTLREEIKLTHNYLSIQNMRMDRIHFQIIVPDAMLELKLPRLIVQPIIENAIIHGLEPREGIGMIKVTGFIGEHGYEIVCEDDGVGLSDQELLRLRQKISANAGLDESCGLRNVHQRLVHKYGGASGLTLEHSSKGGLRATIRWRALSSGLESE